MLLYDSILRYPLKLNYLNLHSVSILTGTSQFDFKFSFKCIISNFLVRVTLALILFGSPWGYDSMGPQWGNVRVRQHVRVWICTPTALVSPITRHDRTMNMWSKDQAKLCGRNMYRIGYILKFLMD